jgi:hypothetical protein
MTIAQSIQQLLVPLMHGRGENRVKLRVLVPCSPDSDASVGHSTMFKELPIPMEFVHIACMTLRLMGWGFFYQT